ncbi:hypothetical protein Tco_1049441 [Tanacetum coccineum]
MVTLVDGVLANGVVMIFEMDIAFYAIQRTEILSLMIRLQILSIILPISHTHLHNPNMRHTLVVSLAWETISKIEHDFEDKQYQTEGILELFRKLHDAVQNIHEELAEYINTPSWNRPTIYYDDDDDDEDYTIVITPDLLKSDSLIMEDKHLDAILEPESDELIKSSVEDLVHAPSESDGISESECDLPVCDDSSLKKDEVLDDIISIPPGNGNDHFNAESSLIESVLNRDNVISSLKIDFLIEEFTGELALIAPIPPGIVKVDLDPKEDIYFIDV